jgi:hypothetical protein
VDISQSVSTHLRLAYAAADAGHDFFHVLMECRRRWRLNWNVNPCVAMMASDNFVDVPFVFDAVALLLNENEITEVQSIFSRLQRFPQFCYLCGLGFESVGGFLEGPMEYGESGFVFRLDHFFNQVNSPCFSRAVA